MSIKGNSELYLNWIRRRIGGLHQNTHEFTCQFGDQIIEPEELYCEIYQKTKGRRKRLLSKQKLNSLGCTGRDLTVIIQLSWRT